MIPEKPIRTNEATCKNYDINTHQPVEKENKKASRATKEKNIMPKASKKQKPKKDVANKAKRRVLRDLNTSSESDISLRYVRKMKTIILINAWYLMTLVATMSYGTGALLVAYEHTLVAQWDSPKGYVCDNC